MLLYGKSEINDIIYDSRNAAAGCLFVCLRGAVTDGHKYAPDAYRKGCRVFLCEQKLELPNDAVQYTVNDTRIEMALLSAQFFGYPAKKLKLIGITGTKGKTSVATFVYDALNRSGHSAGYIGTTGIFIADRHTLTQNSTPESYELHKAFDEMTKCGIEYAVMEVSSQAYKAHRVYGLNFDVGVFTNLSAGDHVGPGEHETFADYRDCKSQLFEHSDIAIVNADDRYSEYMTRHSDKIITYGIKNSADIRGRNINLWRRNGLLGVEFDCTVNDLPSVPISVRTPGEFSVYNALAAISICAAQNIKIDIIRQTLENTSVKGRFEIVGALDYATFIVDYAHNELSMRSALETLRYYSPKRLICLFGSVGGRTSIRRESLGKTAAAYADLCILTSDNPDFEPPMNIISDIERGIKSSDISCPYVMIPNREQALKYAVSIAEDGDIVLCAGKGHEDYQLINGVKTPFSERSFILRYAAELQKI